MIADLGTKRSASLDDVGPESQWICGLDWMSGDKSVFPVWTADELIQNAETEQEVKKEMISMPINYADPISSTFSAVHMLTRYVPEGLPAPIEIPSIFSYQGDQYVLTTGKYCHAG